MSLSLPLLRSCQFIGVVFVLSAAGAHAQEIAAPALTLSEALHRAAERNPSLAAQSYHERVAEALIEQAGFRPNPTLDITAENFLGTGQVQGARKLETTVQANQALERGGKRDKRVTLASRERDMAAREFAVRRAEVLTATAVAFAEAIAAQQRLVLAEEPLKLARETLAAVDARVATGAASRSESARARASIASAQAESARAEAALASARTVLAATYGGTSTDLGTLSGEIRLPAAIPSEEIFLAGLGKHPRLELQQAIIASRRASLGLQQSQAVQDVTVGGGVRFLREGTDAAFVAGVSVPLPIRHKNQGNIRAARETLVGAEQGTRVVESELHTAFAAAWQDLKTAHAAAQNLRRDALPATEEAYAVVHRAYEEGQLPLIDVLDAQRALVAIRREILDAESAYAVALARAEGLAAPTFPSTTSLLSSE